MYKQYSLTLDENIFRKSEAEWLHDRHKNSMALLGLFGISSCLWEQKHFSLQPSPCGFCTQTFSDSQSYSKKHF